MKIPSPKSGGLPRFAGSAGPRQAMASPAAAAPAAGAAKVAPLATVRGADPIVSLTAPIDRPSPPSLAKAAPVAACGDDDLMSQRQ